GQRELEVRDDGFVWSQEIPVGMTRYTMQLDDRGRWVETGQISRDGGETWHAFFGMTLTRR
ncbi:MAG: hypothetical protein R3244_08150, partial [Thermoanaerobaculia bacterium]|nr:hypothetical protein [Thermoanaerobaculia bacterium]